MAFERKDRVKDTTTTTGTGTVTLTGTAPSGYRSVSAAHTDGATVRYAISAGAEWEVGEGIYTASGTTLSRASVLASSNAGALVNFSAGTKDVITTLTANEVDGLVKGPASATANSLARFNGTTGKLLKDGAVIGVDVASLAANTFTGTQTIQAPIDISHASAGQIVFPASQNASANANTLDDYEEGTWTPAFAFGGGTIGITYSNQIGAYTKIGNFLFGTGLLTLTNKGSSTGSATITGLPFSSLAWGTLLISQNAGITFADQLTGHTNGTTITLQETTNTGALSNLDGTDFSNTSQLIFSFICRI